MDRPLIPVAGQQQPPADVCPTLEQQTIPLPLIRSQQSLTIMPTYSASTQMCRTAPVVIFACIMALFAFAAIRAQGGFAVIPFLAALLPGLYILHRLYYRRKKYLSIFVVAELMLYGLVVSTILAAILESISELLISAEIPACLPRKPRGKLKTTKTSPSAECDVVLTLYFVLCVGFVEEFTKFLPLSILKVARRSGEEDKSVCSCRRRLVDSPIGLCLAGCATAGGFALGENLCYTFPIGSTWAVSVGIAIFRYTHVQRFVLLCPLTRMLHTSMPHVPGHPPLPRAPFIRCICRAFTAVPLHICATGIAAATYSTYCRFAPAMGTSDISRGAPMRVAAATLSDDSSSTTPLSAPLTSAVATGEGTTAIALTSPPFPAGPRSCLRAWLGSLWLPALLHGLFDTSLTLASLYSVSVPSQPSDPGGRGFNASHPGASGDGSAAKRDDGLNLAGSYADIAVTRFVGPQNLVLPWVFRSPDEKPCAGFVLGRGLSAAADLLFPSAPGRAAVIDDGPSSSTANGTNWQLHPSLRLREDSAHHLPHSPPQPPPALSSSDDPLQDAAAATAVLCAVIFFLVTIILFVRKFRLTVEWTERLEAANAPAVSRGQESGPLELTPLPNEGTAPLPNEGTAPPPQRQANRLRAAMPQPATGR